MSAQATAILSAGLPFVDYATLGKTLKAARKGAGLTQEQLAQRLGCAQPTISQLERASRTGDGAQRRAPLDLVNDWLAACGLTMAISITGPFETVLNIAEVSR